MISKQQVTKHTPFFPLPCYQFVDEVILSWGQDQDGLVLADRLLSLLQMVMLPCL